MSSIKFKKLEAIEKTVNYIAYDCDCVLYISLKKGAVVSDHSHSHSETIFLMSGSVEAIVGEEKQIITAPGKAVIPANTYHKFTTLEDSIALEIK